MERAALTETEIKFKERGRRRRKDSVVYYVFNGGERSLRICTIKDNMVRLINFFSNSSFDAPESGRLSRISATFFAFWLREANHEAGTKDAKHLVAVSTWLLKILTAQHFIELQSSWVFPLFAVVWRAKPWRLFRRLPSSNCTRYSWERQRKSSLECCFVSPLISASINKNNSACKTANCMRATQ